MKNMKKTGLILMALLMTLALSMAAFAEGETETQEAAGTAAAGTAVEEALAAAEEAKAAETAQNEALNEALTAYATAKNEARKLAWMNSLKEELDGYVAAGSLTQEQAELILNYYAVQLTQTQNGKGMGKGGKGMRNMNGVQNSDVSTNNGNAQNPGFGKGGRHGMKKNMTTSAPAATEAQATDATGV